MENRQFEAMLAVAQERLAQHAPEDIAGKTGAQYADCPAVGLHDSAAAFQMARADTAALSGSGGRCALSGQTITFSQYKDGLVRGGGLDRNAELIVRRDLGILPPEELERRCRLLGVEILPSNADFCARFDFAPRYPVWLKVWFADEEFPASGRLLLDESAPHYLTIEDAVTVGSLILDQLTGAQHWAV